MKGTFYIIGVGPGDPELLTQKALRLLKECPVICVPKGTKAGKSVALSIVQQAISIDNKEVLEVHFPMEKIRMEEERNPLLEKAWRVAAGAVVEKLTKGLDVAFPTLGDPTFYSTAFHLAGVLPEVFPDGGSSTKVSVVVVPGVTSVSASAAAAGMPLCLGDERVAVLPATYEKERLLEAFFSFDTVVLMKAHKVLDKVLLMLGDLGLLETSIIIEKAGMKGERVIKASEALGQKLHYFSTMIVRKK